MDTLKMINRKSVRHLLTRIMSFQQLETKKSEMLGK